jgi:hypothetical protein
MIVVHALRSILTHAVVGCIVDWVWGNLDRTTMNRHDVLQGPSPYP